MQINTVREAPGFAVARHIYSMLVQCWASVADVGLAITHSSLVVLTLEVCVVWPFLRF